MTSAWTGVITGAVGFLSLTGFFPLVMANALGAMLWFFLVDVRLLRLSQADPDEILESCLPMRN